MKKQDYGCFVGFDGYIDTLYTVVQSRKNAQEFTAFDTIAAFGQRVVDSAGKSADIEILPHVRKIGGNAPILANALGTLGVQTLCVGQMDCEGDNPFDKLHPNCTSISTGPASLCTALEFSDGKIMLGDPRGSDLRWQQVKDCVPNLGDLLENVPLLCVVNWSGLYLMNELLRGLHDDILVPQYHRTGVKKDLFLDLADPSARSEDDLRELLDIIQLYADVCNVTLGLNRNEAQQIGRLVGAASLEMDQVGQQILKAIDIHQILIHFSRKAYGVSKQEFVALEGEWVAAPVQTTGAGDHFNAGFCKGLLEKLSLEDCVKLAQRTATFYVSTGITPTREVL